MGSMNVENEARALFTRINTNPDGKIDKKEADAAKDSLKLFHFTDNMTEEQFVNEYTHMKFNSEAEEDEFQQQVRNTHVKFIQHKYGVKTEIQEGESIELFEARAKDEGLNNAIDAEIKKMKPDFALESASQAKNSKQAKSSTPRMSYSKALSILNTHSEQTKLNMMKDGGSTSCTINTPEGEITISINRNLGDRKHNGYITISYPDGEIEMLAPDGHKVDPKKEKDNKESQIDKFDRLINPEKYEVMQQKDSANSVNKNPTKAMPGLYKDESKQLGSPAGTPPPNVLMSVNEEYTVPDPTMIRDPKTHDW